MEKNPNWIAERIKCDMGRLWRDVCDILREDAARMQAAAKDHGWSATYTVTPEEDIPYVLTLRGDREDRDCSWRYDSAKSRVIFTLTNPSEDYVMTTRWDAESCQCRVRVAHQPAQKVTEFPHDQLWKAVQYILEPFFFPADG